MYYDFRLTAFVLKSFVQAKPYIFIDDGIIIKMVDWIIKYQNMNGSVWEPGRVIHKAMQVLLKTFQAFSGTESYYIPTAKNGLDGTFLKSSLS